MFLIKIVAFIRSVKYAKYPLTKNYASIFICLCTAYCGYNSTQNTFSLNTFEFSGIPFGVGKQANRQTNMQSIIFIVKITAAKIQLDVH